MDLWAPVAGRTLLPAHPYLLWVNAPGVREEQGVQVRINSLGLRGPEPTSPKPQGERRLLVTGDSVVYGFGVEESALFTHVAAEALGVEGWTAAVPGYSTFQTINLLEMSALSMAPDVVVIANLWSDLGVIGFSDREVLAAWGSFTPGPVQGWAAHHSAVFRWTRHAVRAVQYRTADDRILAWRDRPTSGTSTRRVSIQDYAANLDRLVAISQERGAEVAFLDLPIRATVDGADPGGSEAAYAAVMRHAASRHGAPLVDGAAALRGGPPDRLWRDATHLSEAGHARVAAALVDALRGWAAGAPLMGAGTGEPRAAWVDPNPRPEAAPQMKVPDDMIP